MSVMFPIKNIFLVILLSFFTLQSCVKFEPPGEVAAPNKVVNKNSQDNTDNVKVTKKVDTSSAIARHRFPLGTVFSFNHFVDMEFSIDSGIDQGGIVHVQDEKGAIFLSASAATVGYISNFKVDTTYPVDTLYVSYEKESKKIVKEINIVKGLNSVTLR